MVQTTCGRGGKWLGTRRVPPLPGRREFDLSRFRPDADAVGIRIEPDHELKARDLPTQERAFKTSTEKPRIQPNSDVCTKRGDFLAASAKEPANFPESGPSGLHR